MCGKKTFDDVWEGHVWGCVGRKHLMMYMKETFNHVWEGHVDDV